MHHRHIGVWAIVVGIIVCGAFPSFAQPGAGPSPLKKVTFKKQELDEYALAQILRIDSMSGAYELNAKPAEIAFGLEFYKNGKKLDVKDLRAGIGGPAATLPTSGEFALQMVDMDHLKLADGKADHLRMNVYLRLTGAPPGKTNLAGVLPVDIPKTTFRSVAARGAFPLSAGDAKKAPLFWLASQTTDRAVPPIKPASTVAELLEKNKDRSFIVGSLYFDGAKP